MYASLMCRYIKTSKAEKAVLIEASDLSPLRRGPMRFWVPIKCIKGGWKSIDALVAIDEPLPIMVSWLRLKMGIPGDG